MLYVINSVLVPI